MKSHDGVERFARIIRRNFDVHRDGARNTAASDEINFGFVERSATPLYIFDWLRLVDGAEVTSEEGVRKRIAQRKMSANHDLANTNGGYEMDTRANSHSPILLIGVGNEFRSDDGLGVDIARALRRRSYDGVRVLEQSGEGTSLIAGWSGAAHVLIVDAVSSGESAGTLHRINAIEERIPKHMFNSSSHTFGVSEAVELARQMNQLPITLMLYGIEGESFDFGVGLSESVVRRIPDLFREIEQELKLLSTTAAER